MFGKRALLEKIANLEERNKNLQDRKDEKEQKQLNAAYSDVDACTHVFDWAAVGAFSIERNIKKENGEMVAYTIIGYTRDTTESGGICTGEWSFSCSTEEHNRLAKEFQDYLATKSGRGSKQTKSKPTLLTESKPASKSRK